MENTALTFIENVSLQQVSATMQKIAQFQAIVQGTLKRDHDFGVIPGTAKPTLLKPGAEKILTLMGMTSEYEVTEKIQDYENGFFAFTVKCILSRHGLKITEGLGHANTKEGRYAKRWVTEKKLPEGIDKKSLQSREKEGKYGKYTEYLVGNDDPYTLANTVLKMAKKRSQVDAALTVASLSDIFTQDLEDQIQEEAAQQTKTEPAKEAAKPAQKSEQKQQAKSTQAGTTEIISTAQAKRMFALADGDVQIVREVLEKHNYESSKDVRKADYEAICEEIQALAKPEEEVDLPWEEEAQ